jgi:uncharacterized protein
MAGTLWSYLEHKGNLKFVEQVAAANTILAEGGELTKDLKDATIKWNTIEYKKSPEYVKEKNENMRKGYFQLVAHLAPENMETDTSWFYRYNLWDILAMMMIGIALFRWKVVTGEKSYKFYALMVLISYPIGLGINWYEINLIRDSNFSYLGFSKANITYDIGRVAMAMGHIGVIMMFSKLPVLLWLKNGLAAVGKMALTNYIMHSIICMIIFTGVGFGLFGTLQRYELYYVVFAIWIFQLILSPIWLKYYYYGPLEWVWRSLSYRYKSVFRKEKVSRKFLIL